MKTQSVQLSLVKIPVSNIDTAVPYYRDVLGLEEQFFVPDYGWAQFLVGDFPIALYEPGEGGGGSSGQCDSIHFSVADIEATHHLLLTRNADIPRGVEIAADGMLFFELYDIDGNVIKVLQAQKQEA